MSDSQLPAILGGPPIRPSGPPSWPQSDPEIHQALMEAIQDGSWGTYLGPHVPNLESSMRQYFDCLHLLACSSGTLAVEVALRAVALQSGDEVLLPAYDYEANLLSVHAVGATAVAVDTDAITGTIDPESIRQAITPRTKAVLVSHLHGGLARMQEIRTIADEHGLRVIEDAAQCPGAIIKGRKAGTWGDIGTLSFGGSKLLTAGRGGAILTADPVLFQRARLWLARGVQKWAPLSELQAITLLPQLSKLDARNAVRFRRVQELDERLLGVPGLRRIQHDRQDVPAFYKVGYYFDPDAFGISREKFVLALRAEGIAFDSGFRAIHIGRSSSRCRVDRPLPNAERMHRNIVILHHPVLLGSDSDIEEVASAVWKTYRNAGDLAP